MEKDKSPNFHIRTFGCQMNVRDSEAISSILIKEGFRETERIDDADILILNTCSVRDSAERKVEGLVWQLREWKEAGERRIICLLGCMAQSEGESIVEKFPHVDIVAGTSAISSLPNLIKKVASEGGHAVETAVAQSPYEDLASHRKDRKVPSAFIAVMRGCSMRCSYCIVPSVRGDEKSRPEKEILEEAARLADDGAKEIFLLGQNIAAYGLDDIRGRTHASSPLAALLAKIAKIDAVKRIRFTSPHPANFNDELIEAVCSIEKICDCLHLPLQSGSDKILALMKRGYTASEYLRIVERLKSGRPAICFSTDIIVGFPGETHDDFELTRKLLNKVGFDQQFVFKYSKRKGTPASVMRDQVPQSVKEERNQLLLSDLKERALARNKAMLGSKIEILIERRDAKRSSRLIGRSSSGKTVVAESKESAGPGDFATALIEDYTAAALYGRIV